MEYTKEFIQAVNDWQIGGTFEKKKNYQLC